MRQSWTPAKEINWIKNALKKDYLYDENELRRLKRRLRDLRRLKYDMSKGNGFGNGKQFVMDMTSNSLTEDVAEIRETIDQIDKVAL